MRRFRKKKKIKLSIKILFISLLIIFFAYIITYNYYKTANPKIIDATKIVIDKMIKQFLSTNIGYDILNDDVLDDVLVIYKNKEGEILYVDYNLEQAYYVLDVVTEKITYSINSLEQGTIDVKIYDENLKATESGLMLELPLFVASDNTLLTNLGPKVYVKVNFVGSILTNIKTKITNYGMNNALVELYVTIEINSDIMSPVLKTDNKLYYDVLIAAKVINGAVPEFYGGSYLSESSLYEKND